jgi:hypothetical protein
MRPGAGQMNFIPSDSVNQKPIRFDVRVAIALPVPFQRMIL